MKPFSCDHLLKQILNFIYEFHGKVREKKVYAGDKLPRLEIEAPKLADKKKTEMSNEFLCSPKIDLKPGYLLTDNLAYLPWFSLGFSISVSFLAVLK